MNLTWMYYELATILSHLQYLLFQLNHYSFVYWFEYTRVLVAAENANIVNKFIEVGWFIILSFLYWPCNHFILYIYILSVIKQYHCLLFTSILPSLALILLVLAFLGTTTEPFLDERITLFTTQPNLWYVNISSNHIVRHILSEHSSSL